MIVEKIVDFVDEYYHLKRIGKYLSKLNLVECANIGSHKGEFLKHLVKIKSIKKIHVFEPQKNIFRILKLNFSKNTNIVFNNIAVSNEKKKKKLKINKFTKSSSFSDRNKDSLWHKIRNIILFTNNSVVDVYEVPTITLDEYLWFNKIKNIDLVTIDTEGHELQVLQGSINILNNVKYILIECPLNKMFMDYDFEKCNELLVKKNFSLMKKFKFPLHNYEDRLYINLNMKS